MKKQFDIYCGLGSRSEKLPGAISPNMEFFYFSKITDEWGTDEKIAYKSIIQYINNDFDLDYKNEIITCDEGALLEAYNFADMENVEYLKTLILIQNVDKYPGYNLKMVEKEFPIDIISGPGEEPKEVVNSTHVLCITNYEDIINKTYSQKMQ